MDSRVEQETSNILETDSDSIDASLDNDDISEKLRAFVNHSNKDITSAFCETFTKVFKTTPYFTFAEYDADDCLRFSCQVQVKRERIQGSVRSSKKSAKLDCSRRALEYLLENNLTFTSDSGIRGLNFFGMHSLPELLRQHAYSKFYQLASQYPSVLGTEMVLAAFFIFDSVSQDFQLVSLATGSKCIQGQALSLSGGAVVDCHAEILARRGLLRFIYTQLFMYKRSSDQSIFQKKDGKIKLKERYSFHLFINTPPCGDGRVYERSFSFSANKNAGNLRYKLEKGMGTVFGDSSTPQTIDGIISGARLRIMSCSDKLLKWNVLGLQGCILSRLISPVYMSSLNIGEPTEASSLTRAVFGRLGSVGEADTGSCFYIGTPSLFSAGRRQGEDSLVKPCNICVNWNISDNTAEVVNTTTGLLEVLVSVDSNNSSASRLSKLAFMKLSKKLFSEFDEELPSNFSYNNLKAACVEYENLQCILRKRLEDMNLGIWQQVPYEISSFVP